jgi:hypothetical protein
VAWLKDWSTCLVSAKPEIKLQKCQGKKKTKDYKSWPECKYLQTAGVNMN